MDEQAREYLKRFGYLDEEEEVFDRDDGVVISERTAGRTQLMNALEEAQRFMGIPVTGVFDEATLEMMQAPRCGNVDVGERSVAGTLPAKWQRKTLNVLIESWLPTSIVPTSVQEGIFDTAFSKKGAWGEFIDITFNKIAAGRYDIKVFCSPIDGPGNVLAQAYLADGNDSPLTLQLDSSERKWGLVLGSAEANLLGVIQHELGHNLGLGHLQDKAAMMFPYANSNLIHAQPADIAAAVRLGYQKVTGVDPPPPSPGTTICEAVLACLKGFNSIRRPLRRGELTMPLEQAEQAKMNAVFDACKNVDLATLAKIAMQLLGACQPVPTPAAAAGPCGGIAALLPCCGAIQECFKIFKPT